MKVPIGCNGAPQICPKSTPFRGLIAKPQYLPHPWTCPTYVAKRHPDPIRHFSIMHWIDRRTDRQVVHGKFDRYRPLRSESDAA